METMRFSLFLILLLTFASPVAARQDPVLNDAVDTSGQPGPPSPARIELESPDGEIAARLRGLFAELDGLEDVGAVVRGGVVTLTGTVLSADDSQKAESIASRLAGVVSVQNDTQIEHRVERRLEPMIARAEKLAEQTIAFLPLLLLALIVFLAIWLLGRLLTRSMRLFKRIAPNPLVQTLIAQIVQLLFVLLGLILAMRILGATALLGSVLGAAGVLGLAVGFAVRDTIENYIASILLSIRRPFAPNDHVIIEGLEGRVTRLNSRATFLTSLDGNELRIPNAIVYKAKIINFSQIPERRFEFLVGVGYENDLCEALVRALAATRSVDGVLADPEPSVIIDALDPSTVALKIHGWVDQGKSDFAKVRSEAIRSVKTAFDEQSISMPEPIQNVRAINKEDRKPKPPPKQDRVAAQQVGDTSADRTIENKVNELRSGAGEDLLTTDAPRE